MGMMLLLLLLPSMRNKVYRMCVLYANTPLHVGKMNNIYGEGSNVYLCRMKKNKQTEEPSVRREREKERKKEKSNVCVVWS